MLLRVEERIEGAPEAVFDFVARDHWRNHPRWDPSIDEIVPLDPGPIHAGSRARVKRKKGSGDEILEVVAFEPNSRWVSRSEIGPFTLQMTALIDPVDHAASRLSLIADTEARGVMRYALPLLAPVFRRQMRTSLSRIKEMVRTEI
jgi:hypothetical protein